jgi:hypothetical protein
MWKAIIASVALFGSAFAFSATNTGFDKAGKYYLQKKKMEQRSVRSGSAVRSIGRSSSGGIRGGK